MGGAFGGGNAATVFGGSGASTFLRKLTAGAGTIFMMTSMVLAFLASHNSADALEKFGEQQEKLAQREGSGQGEGARGRHRLGLCRRVRVDDRRRFAPGAGSARGRRLAAAGSAAPAAGAAGSATPPAGAATPAEQRPRAAETPGSTATPPAATPPAATPPAATPTRRSPPTLPSRPPRPRPRARSRRSRSQRRAADDRTAPPPSARTAPADRRRHSRGSARFRACGSRSTTASGTTSSSSICAPPPPPTPRRSRIRAA